MPRFLSIAGGDKETLKLAVLFMLTYPGAPCIYYGDEIGLRNGPTTTPEDCRFSFPWDEKRWDHDLLAHYQRCIALRHAHAALRTGSFEVVYAQGSKLAFLRRLDGQSLLVAINNSTQSWALDLPAQVVDGSLKGLLGGKEAQTRDRRLSEVSLPPRSGEVFFLS